MAAKVKKRKPNLPEPRGMEDLTEAEWQAEVDEVESSGAFIKDVALLHNLNYDAFKKYVQ
jgi:hypothetical protein